MKKLSKLGKRKEISDSQFWVSLPVAKCGKGILVLKLSQRCPLAAMDRNPETFLRSKGMRIYIYKYIYDSNISLQDTPYVLALSVFFSSCPMSRFFYPSADFFFVCPMSQLFFFLPSTVFFPHQCVFFLPSYFFPCCPPCLPKEQRTYDQLVYCQTNANLCAKTKHQVTVLVNLTQPGTAL